ncbi:MAG: DUF1549 and DUF1553 domain-containing protein [Prosthecobacter sp.]
MFRVFPLLPITGLIAFSICQAAAPSIENGRAHWAFQPLSKAPLPEVKAEVWLKNDIDRFILAKLETAGLQPSAEADRATLIRRVTLDLIGLPPTPDEVEAFMHDESPRAYEALIDRLLDSPHYGERWGRHWLDLARYADTCGVHNDLDRPYAWKYRDYVIQSINDDKPYARFVAEQLAGDEVENADEQSLIATGFCRNGQSNDDNMGKTKEVLEQYRVDQLDDVIATTSTVFLGLTVGCARCHDHKTDPILAKDYYSLLAIFNGTEKLGMAKGAKDTKDKDIKDTNQVMALIEKKPDVPRTHVLLRGMAAAKGDEVQPAMLTVLAGKPIEFPKPAGTTSLRRRTLADWITAPSNSLTWRVLANRLWQHHFGTGIVASPSNFGFTGAKPTHPELLDYLAQELITNGGHLKPLHKLMLMSATYRQVSSAEHGADPNNSLLWRMNKQRMEAEVLRDSILAASGKLNLKLSGPGIKPRIRADLLDASQRNKWPALDKETPEQWRRSVYIYVKRQLLMPSMELFDAPTTTDSCALRMQSTVPTQALVMMNDEFVEEQARFLAERAQRESGDDLLKSIERLFHIVLSHSPSESRKTQAIEFVKQRELESDRMTALTDLCHVLLNSSQFVYIE